jgi:zinc-finger protein CreA/MIG
MMADDDMLMLFFQQDAIFARPTVLGHSAESSHPTRRASQHVMPNTLSTAFTTLSSVAMDELYALEREEAIRRAEYEARHADVLRRAEATARLTAAGTLLSHSQSTTTSPVSTPWLSSPSHLGEGSGGTDGGGYFGLSSERDRHRDDDREREDRRRRMSNHSYSLGHLVDHSSSHRTTAGYHHYHPHPYQTASSSHHRHFVGQIPDESPSPVSSEPELLPVSPQAPTSSQRGSSMFSLADGPSAASAAPNGGSHHASYTPSTSPFLGPLRTLNIHSTEPSRAPSPILLPPASMPISPGPNTVTYGSSSSNIPSTTSSATTSPYMSARSVPASRRRSLNSAYLSSEGNGSGLPGTLMYAPHSSSSHYHHHHHHNHHPSSSTSVYNLPTPQLSSGPSSGGSSPRSAFSSRAPSPPASASSSSATTPTTGPGSHHQPYPHHHHHHHHLAHSVRMAFGMTPIHPNGPSTSSGGAGAGSTGSRRSKTNSNVILPSERSGMMVKSMPTSRSGSPPITLAPLNFPALARPGGIEGGVGVSGGLPAGGEGGVGEKVELPHFKEVEAAVRAGL